jgi:hypothetical protein
MVLGLLVWLLFMAVGLGAQVTDPGTLEQLGNLRVGQVLDVVLTGSAEGPLWGTGIYTTDSRLATAAVHAGVVRVGQRATVRVEILDGAPEYRASSSNGVASAGWGSYGLSFRFVQAAGKPLPARVDRPVAAFTDPAVLGQLAAFAGQAFHFFIQGGSDGSVWGSGPYTADSSLAAAAVHAGALRPGQSGLVRVGILPGQAAYTGSSRNGVNSAAWGGYHASFMVEAAAGSHTPLLFATHDARALPDALPGASLVVLAVGSRSGSVWGSGIYTADSHLGTAAVHAGLLQPERLGIVRVRVLPGQGSYTGSTRNGVTTAGYGGYDLSYQLEAWE